MQYADTEIEAEWSVDNHVVLSTSHGGEPPKATGIERQSENTVWLPVVREFPDTYIPGRARLLGRVVYVLSPDGAAVHATYPDADFSPQAFRDDSELIAHERAQEVLSETDWYVIRKAELGTPIPAEVASARASVRGIVSSEVAKVRAMAAAELRDYDAVEVNNTAKALRDVVNTDRLKRTS